LKHSAFADFANSKGTTALMRASQEGHVEISDLLIRAHVDVNRKNNEGMNALMLSSQRGHAEMTLLLIKAGASMDEQTTQGSTALMLACKRNHEKVVEVLVSMGCEVFMRDGRGRTAKDTALRRNHVSLLRWLDTQVQIERIQVISYARPDNLIPLISMLIFLILPRRNLADALALFSYLKFARPIQMEHFISIQMLLVH
jgi:ankyrin repeat protein